MSRFERESKVSQKELATVLFENKLLSSANIQDLMGSPEFQILHLLNQFSELSDSEIETKYQAPQSLSMILSNLSADGLIEQTGSYKWQLSVSFKSKLTSFEEKETYIKDEKERSFEKEKIVKRKVSKKMEYKRIVDALEHSPYVPAQYTAIEELYEVAELELLVIINRSAPISTEILEETYSHTNPISLTLSNLKADNLITESMDYKWELHAEFRDKLKLVHVVIPKEATLIEDTTVESLSDTVNLIEQSQFIKMLLDMEYFKNMSLTDIMKTDEFGLLNTIYRMSPISQELLEIEMPDLPSLPMSLSNLKIDGLIDQDNDYDWKLEDEFRSKMYKLKVDRADFMNEIRDLDRKIAKKKLKAALTADRPSAKILAIDEIIKEDENVPSVPIETQTKYYPQNDLQDILLKHKYIQEKIESTTQLLEVPEFLVITTLFKHDKLSADELEEITSLGSVSLTISNLSADQIIRQTMDYKWELSVEISDLTDVMSEKPIQKKITSDVNENPTDSPILQNNVSKPKPFNPEDAKNLALACKKKGYLEDNDVEEKLLRQTPEYEILSLIQNKTSISSDDIKSSVESVSPVLISRTISKLVADDCIELEGPILYTLTQHFKELLIEEELLIEKSRIDEIERKKEEEKTARLKELESELLKVAHVLINNGLIKAETRDPAILMRIPEFEIIALLNQHGSMSMEELKGKAESVAPVQISHTVSKLVASDLVDDSSADTLTLSTDLKNRISKDD